MRKLTIMLIPGRTSQPRQISVPYFFIRVAFIGLLLLSGLTGFVVLDYQQLRQIRSQHYELMAENQHLKGEANILMTNLDEVKRSLRRIQDYTSKLDEIVNLKVNRVSKHTGIGPLSAEEYTLQKRAPKSRDVLARSHVPLGINIDHLIFRPVLDELAAIEDTSQEQAIELQHLLSTLSQKQSLLSSIPSLSPVDGWMTSKFGVRISPFTGRRTWHKGIDIAAPVGTPILAPADGVVIFAGAKTGFGNFVMIAHYGYGIVTRYGHNAQNMVQAGQKVKRNEQIASVGMSGRTTGPHLHYEIWVNGQAVSPRKFILDTNMELF